MNLLVPKYEIKGDDKYKSDFRDEYFEVHNLIVKLNSLSHSLTWLLCNLKKFDYFKELNYDKRIFTYFIW